ncbi:rhodanese-like domain-containing protein 8, chloroplastic isoform X2 [Cryptomeria japonica]|uniref:rhodanese-like domain-containing protein 8, chloroplastic isoform X2 n=1 Tax=Cryptomeria japonica TaxID=3369 RepID=UPI0025AD7B27|nr:rhodanese-like domain-containing protein 8, chloroplastic isoform X2 [Cryptomeria japonica]
MSLVLSTKPTTFQAHWKTDSHLSLRYPNHRNSNHIRSFSSFSGLIGFKKKFSLKKGGCLIESYRHGIHVGKSLECGGRVNFDIPAENREDACQSVQAQKMACSGLEFLAVSFYHFVRIEDPQEEVAKHQEFLEYSGPVLDALAYAEWVKEDARFKHILVQMSPSSTHAFPRLKLRYKSSLIQVEGGVSDLPILDSSMRALPLTPREWKIRLSIINCSETESDEIATKENTSLNQGRKSLLLDVRNGYEWDIGHFQGAKRPDVDCFRSTTFGISDLKTNISDPLARIDKENTDILMYCTGGIRCDVYSAILRKKGFQNLYTLKGGISHYLKEEGPFKWIGNLFVFDSRLSVAPKVYKPIDAANIQRTGSRNERIEDDEDSLELYNGTFGRCYLCGSHLAELRHRNCANPDCNRLILSCHECVENFRGCCSTPCTSAPRLRPILRDGHRYERWHVYRDSKH